jgi:N6-adenosine-specific RNA methylase IME4
MRYRTIVADPPWPYDGFLSMPRGDTWTHSVRKPLPYKSMTLAEIAALPIADLADPAGAFLWCWTTNRYLPDTFGLLNGWGFTYAQTFVWRKTGSPSPFGGTAAPNHAEYLLVARRGSPKLIGRAPSSIIDAPAMSGRRVRAHSRKPECFLDLAEQVSPGPYVELFARRARFGWDYWGDESLGTAEVAA